MFGGSMNLSRRVVLGTSAATLLSSCMTCGERLPILTDFTAIGDAHAHFFNASDLPIFGFIKYVAGKGMGSNSLPILGAATVLQTLANFLPISAEAEMAKLDRHMRSSKPATLNVGKEKYANEFSDKLDNLTAEAFDRQKKASDLESFLTSTPANFDIQSASSNESDFSLVALSFIFRAEQPDDDNALGFIDENDVDAAKRFFKTDSRYILDILNNDTAAIDERLAEINDSDGGQKFFRDDITPKQIYAYIRWGYLMMQSRCALVGEYLKKINVAGSSTKTRFQPKVMVNLMVDYDYWITPNAKQPRSKHISQIEFWDKYSNSVKNQIDIHTFTGFDPLKLAVEKQLGIKDTHFSKLTKLYETNPHGRPSFSGFKIYPPMGFRPWNNAALKDDDFVGKDEDGNPNGVGSRILDLWNSDWGGNGVRLGEALDAALADAYDFCLKHDIPILAHASPSVLTAENFDERPNPIHWLNLVKSKKTSVSGYNYANLRLDLGHFTTAEKFIQNDHIWSRTNIRELFELSTGLGAENRNVYADIGMMDEFILDFETENTDLAYRFFKELGTFCEDVDENCERLMFGTDWIMLGHVPGHGKYLKLIVEAMDRNEWWTPKRKKNFLYDNLNRFLKRPIQ